MAEIFTRLTGKKARDIKVLADFVSIFCRERHQNMVKNAFPIRDDRLREVLDAREPRLCQECNKLLNHGIAKLMLCPHDPKPMCKKCTTHCYAPGYRERVREVMKFSGLHLIKHGRVDMLLHYFF
ncbi:MAG: nitrous oxide-stimulated promoter family protein [Chloroflexi bacterium]|nr:nitrous oxide-stimulated promoter family protein [Chloroflexota bacterium]